MSKAPSAGEVDLVVLVATSVAFETTEFAIVSVNPALPLLLLTEEPDVSLKPGSAADPFVLGCTSDTALLPFEAAFCGLAARVAAGVAVVFVVAATVRVKLLCTVVLAGLAIAFVTAVADFDAGSRVLADVLTGLAAGGAFVAVDLVAPLLALLVLALFAADLVTVAFMLTLFG